MTLKAVFVSNMKMMRYSSGVYSFRTHGRFVNLRNFILVCNKTMKTLTTQTSSRSLKTQKRNSVNIQPSWLYAWSITHAYFPLAVVNQGVLKNSECVFLNFVWLSAGCADAEKVVDVITSQSYEAPSLRAGLLDAIALALDAKSMVLSNWYTLAVRLGVPRKTCWEFERRSTENPTGRLFQYLATNCPHVTLLSLGKALDSIQRKDLIKLLREENLRGKISTL